MASNNQFAALAAQEDHRVEQPLTWETLRAAYSAEGRPDWADEDWPAVGAPSARAALTVEALVWQTAAAKPAAKPARKKTGAANRRPPAVDPQYKRWCMKHGICFLCGRQGHVSRNCPGQ